MKHSGNKRVVLAKDEGDSILLTSQVDLYLVKCCQSLCNFINLDIKVIHSHLLCKLAHGCLPYNP